MNHGLSLVIGGILVLVLGALVPVGGLKLIFGVFAILVAAAAGLVTVRAWGMPSPSNPPGLKAQEPKQSHFMEGLWIHTWISLGLRLMVVFFVNGTSLWQSFGPDSLTWEYYGEHVLAGWRGATGQITLVEEQLGGIVLYPIANAIAIALFDSARYPLSIVNAFIGVFCAHVAARLALNMYGPVAARRVHILVLYYPSLVLWSAMNLREVWSHAAILLVLLTGQNVRNRFAPMSFGLLLLALVGAYFIRPYLLPLLVVSIAVSMPIVQLRQIPFVMAGLVGFSVLFLTYGEQFRAAEGLLSHGDLTRIQELREGLAYGGSAYGQDVDTRTVGGALRYLPYGVAQFLFAPFPWNVRSWQQLLALPESMVFFFLVIQASRRIIADLVKRASMIAFPMITMMTLTLAYGLVSGNEGTAFRHRAQVVVILLVFAGAQQSWPGQARREDERSPAPQPSVMAPAG